tara:strand:- start:1147 stop:2070 length:924 start_codon:yes stop_codon:yes gene_type:complete
MTPKNNILNSYLPNNNSSAEDYFSVMQNMVENLQSSPEGQQAVQSFKKKEREKKGKNFALKLKELQDLEKNYANRLEYATSRGVSEDTARQALDRSLQSKTSALEKLGMLYRNQSEYGDEVVVENPSDYMPTNVRGFANQGNVMMPKAPTDPIKKMMYDVTMAHEKGHAKRMQQGALLELGDSHWHEREEEQQAIRDSVNMLKSNMERAGMKYNPADAFRLLTRQGSNLDYVKNPSMAPFKNRMEYLPVGKEPTYDVEDYLKKLKKARLGTMRAGLDITAPTKYRESMPNLEALDQFLTKYKIVNES